MVNNVMYQDATQGRTAGFLCCGANSTVANNTIVGNTGTGILANNGGDDAGADVRNNLVCDNSGGQLGLKSARLSNNLTTCPRVIAPY